MKRNLKTYKALCEAYKEKYTEEKLSSIAQKLALLGNKSGGLQIEKYEIINGKLFIESATAYEKEVKIPDFVFGFLNDCSSAELDEELTFPDSDTIYSSGALLKAKVRKKLKSAWLLIKVLYSMIVDSPKEIRMRKSAGRSGENIKRISLNKPKKIGIMELSEFHNIKFNEQTEYEVTFTRDLVVIGNSNNCINEEQEYLNIASLRLVGEANVTLSIIGMHPIFANLGDFLGLTAFKKVSLDDAFDISSVTDICLCAYNFSIVEVDLGSRFSLAGMFKYRDWGVFNNCSNLKSIKFGEVYEVKGKELEDARETGFKDILCKVSNMCYEYNKDANWDLERPKSYGL